jgi:hypothetical protein
MEQTLGFRVVETRGAWQIQYLNEEGEVTRVKPCLIKEVWVLWVMAEAQWQALAATSS